MYTTTKAKHDAIALASAKLFKPIYDAEFSVQYPSELDFYKNHIWFVTLTFKQSKITLLDRVGLSTGRCIYQDHIDKCVGGFVGLNSKSISELQHIAKANGIQDLENLPGRST